MKNVIVKKSKIEGKGVFANRDFKKGEVVYVWDISKTLTKEEVEKLPKEDREHYVTYIGNEKYVLEPSPGRYVNHSCEPNTYVKDNKDIALRDIKKGEEIISDYSPLRFEGWSMKCRCGSPNCRKTIYGTRKKTD